MQRSITAVSGDSEPEDEQEPIEFEVCVGSEQPSQKLWNCCELSNRSVFISWHYDEPGLVKRWLVGRFERESNCR